MMMLKPLATVAVLASVASAPVSAQPVEIGYPERSLGFSAIAANDLGTAEAQLRKEFRIPRDDPARLINYGYVLAKTGRVAEAAKMFEQAAQADEVELVLASGRTMSSRDAALLALRAVSVGGPEHIKR